MLTRSLTLTFALGGWLSLALANWSQPAPQTGFDDGETPAMKAFRAGRAEDLTAELEGAWRLMSFQASDNAATAQKYIDGFATFQGGYMAIIVHTEEVDETFELVPFFQAGIHHYRVDPGSLRLQTSVIIAHHNVDEELPAYEIPYTPREFNIVMLKDELKLQRPDGSVLRFRRSKRGLFPQKTENLLETGRESKGAKVLDDPREGNPFKRRRYK